MSEDSIISLQNVNKWFGDFHVLKDVDLQVKKKEKQLKLDVVILEPDLECLPFTI